MGNIRTFLAIIVIISHTESFFGFNFLGGKIAVQAFYIISGFYMSLILNEKYIGINNSYKLFITNRLIRIYPLYWAVLLLVVIGSILFGISTGGSSYGPLNVFTENYDLLSFSSLVMVIFSNIFIFFQDTLLFFEINLGTGHFFFEPKFDGDALNGFDFALIPQAWTVALELLFYLIAPFIVKRKTSIIVLLLAIFIGLKYFLQNNLGLNHTPWNFRFFPCELTYFLLGVLSYKISNYKNTTLLNPAVNKLIFAFIILFITLFDKIIFIFKDELFFILFFISIPFIFQLSKKSKLDRYIGDLSYSLYICHIFILTIVNRLDFVIINKGITVILFSIVISIILKHLLSDKIEKYRQNRLKRI